MTELFSLGKLYPSDFLKPGEQPLCEPVELKLMLDENGTAYLNETPPDKVMWGERYWYRSSISGTMRGQLRDVVQAVLSVIREPKGLWIDIAGNDAYLLSQVPDGFTKVNIDPANDTFRLEAERHCDLVIQDYFSAEVFKKSKYGNQKANVITCISMFYDLANPGLFLENVYEVLEDDGLFVLQLSYTPLMIEQLEFTNLCHEHKYYYSFFNIKKLLESHRFKLMDVELNNTNAGSFRLFIMKDNHNGFVSQTYADVCKFRMESLLYYERTLKLDQPGIWLNFFERINKLKEQTMNFIYREKALGKTIYGYGSSTKGNTLLQYFGLNNFLIDAIADRSPYKHGLRTTGTNIPIISEDEMRERQPDYLLVLPFHFINEFVEREKDYLDKGGKMIVCLPKFQII